MRRFGALSLAVLLAVTSATLSQAEEVSPPGSDWEGYNKSLEGQRYSLLDQINVSNAANLVEVCRVPVAARGSLQAGLVVIGDTMFATTPTDTFALDPVSCRVKWQHTYRRAANPGLSVNRGVAYLSGRVFRRPSNVSSSSNWKLEPAGSGPRKFRFRRRRWRAILRNFSSQQRRLSPRLRALWRRPSPVARDRKRRALRSGR